MILEDQSTICKNCIFSTVKDVLTDDDYCLLDSNKGEMEYRAGDTIVKQGGFVSQLHFLKTGIVKIVYEEKNGKSTILDLVEAGEFIGLHILSDVDKYSYSVIAFEDCTVCAIRKGVFSSIVDRNEKAKKYLLRKYNEEFSYLYKRIAVLSSRNSHGKLCTTLLYLQESFNSEILNDISRKELAKIASISIESTNKILAELKNDGLIELTSSGIKLEKPELLKMLSVAG